MSTQQPVQPAPQPPVPASAQGKSPLFWILIGCGGLVVLVGIIALVAVLFLGYKAKQFLGEAQKNPALATAKVIAMANPELEVVSEDPEKGTLTIRNKKTGETITVNAEDIQKGKLHFTNEKGETVTIGAQEGKGAGITITGPEGGSAVLGGSGPAQLPSWVPVYSGVSPENVLSAKSDQGANGTYHFETADRIADVAAFYKRNLESAGFKVTSSSMEGEGELTFASVTGEKENGKYGVQVGLTKKDTGETEGIVSYMERASAGAQ